jgi:hypothetical protein
MEQRRVLNLGFDNLPPLSWSQRRGVVVAAVVALITGAIAYSATGDRLRGKDSGTSSASKLSATLSEIGAVGSSLSGSVSSAGSGNSTAQTPESLRHSSTRAGPGERTYVASQSQRYLTPHDRSQRNNERAGFVHQLRPKDMQQRAFS